MELHACGMSCSGLDQAPRVLTGVDRVQNEDPGSTGPGPVPARRVLQPPPRSPVPRVERHRQVLHQGLALVVVELHQARARSAGARCRPPRPPPRSAPSPGAGRRSPRPGWRLHRRRHLRRVLDPGRLRRVHLDADRLAPPPSASGSARRRPPRRRAASARPRGRRRPGAARAPGAIAASTCSRRYPSWSATASAARAVSLIRHTTSDHHPQRGAVRRRPRRIGSLRQCRSRTSTRRRSSSGLIHSSPVRRTLPR